MSFIGFQGRWVQFWHPFRPPSAGLIFDRSGGGGGQKVKKNKTFCMDSKSEFYRFSGSLSSILASVSTSERRFNFRPVRGGGQKVKKYNFLYGLQKWVYRFSGSLSSILASVSTSERRFNFRPVRGGGKKSKNKTFCMDSKSEFYRFSGSLSSILASVSLNRRSEVETDARIELSDPENL